MWWRIVLPSLFAAGTQAFAPAPIQWGNVPGNRFVLAPRSLPYGASVWSNALALPAELRIWHQVGRMSDQVPFFTANPDRTITWMGLCVEAAGDAQTGDAIRLNRCTGGSNQLWKVSSSGRGRQAQFELQGAGKCMASIDAHDQEGNLNGAPVGLSECEDVANDPWIFEASAVLPKQVSSNRLANLNSMRHAILSFLVLAGVGAVSLGAWMYRLQKQTHVLPASHGSMFLNLEDGGISLSTAPTLQETSTNTLGFESSSQKVISALQNVPRAVQSRCGGISMQAEEEFVNVSVTKPLGVVFEEVTEDAADGVFVHECDEDGNGIASGLKPGLRLLEANGIDMQVKTFDECMDVLIDAPDDEPLSLKLVVMNNSSTGEASNKAPVLTGKATLEVTDTSSGSVKTIECDKGEILRNVLLNAGVDLYDFKGKLTNCNGGGQCATCVVAVDASDSHAWADRPDWMAGKLKKYPENCVQSCMVKVEGDASIAVKPNKI